MSNGQVVRGPLLWRRRRRLRPIPSTLLIYKTPRIPLLPFQCIVGQLSIDYAWNMANSYKRHCMNPYPPATRQPHCCWRLFFLPPFDETNGANVRAQHNLQKNDREKKSAPANMPILG